MITTVARSPFNQSVAEEYLKLFDFENISLDQALRLVFQLHGVLYQESVLLSHTTVEGHIVIMM